MAPVTAGQRVDDRYLLETLLENRHGVQVWRATQHPLRRQVVVKLVPQGDDAALERRFQREAEALGRLNHPACVDVYDHGVWQGWLFLVTAWIDGELLADRVGTRWSPSDALTLVTDIASGLAYAHVREVYHRDLSPSRIIIDHVDGRDFARMVDFGSARFADSTLDTTAGGAPYGTPGYMAPERIEGERGDARGDVYAMGVIFFELLTGQHPFRRDRAIETLAAQASGEVPDPASLQPPVQVPRAISWTIDRCTRRNPAERLQDGEALLAALLACRVALSDRRLWKLTPAMEDGELRLPAQLAEPVTHSRSLVRPSERGGFPWMAVLAATAVLMVGIVTVSVILVVLILL